MAIGRTRRMAIESWREVATIWRAVSLGRAKEQGFAECGILSTEKVARPASRREYPMSRKQFVRIPRKPPPAHRPFLNAQERHIQRRIASARYKKRLLTDDQILRTDEAHLDIDV